MVQKEESNNQEAQIPGDNLRVSRQTSQIPSITFKKMWGHFCTITKHKFLVAKHCFAVGLYWQGIIHDLSKYSPTEFFVGARFYQGYRSPNTAEREAYSYSEAWLHHKGRNKHHFEYWIDIVANNDHRLEGKPMPTRYVVEMFCDRVAASKVYKGKNYTNKSPLEYYYLELSVTDLLIDNDANALLRSMLELLEQKGEREAFKEIKNTIVRPKRTYGVHGRF